MGLWSKIKKAAKWIAKKAKAIARVVIRLVVEFISRFVFKIPDLIFGFIGWPPKKLRLYVYILRNEDGDPVVTPEEVQPSINHTRTFLKEKFNIELKAYAKGFVETAIERAPIDALRVHCGIKGFGQEIGDAGEYFAKHLAGWNTIPISLTFPITVFIIEKGLDHPGCSMSILTDYVVVDRQAIKDGDEGLMMHEMGHCCGQPWHSAKSNFMYPDSDRGDGVHWWQKNIVRSSRHVNFL